MIKRVELPPSEMASRSRRKADISAVRPMAIYGAPTRGTTPAERLWRRDCPLLFLAQVFSLQPQASKWNTFDLSLLDPSWELPMRCIMWRILRRFCASSCYPPLPGNINHVSAKTQSGQEAQQAAAPDSWLQPAFHKGISQGVSSTRWKLESHHVPFTGLEGASDQRYS